MICPNCKTDIPEIAIFCPICSYKFPLKMADYTLMRNFAVIALFSTILSTFLYYYLFYHPTYHLTDIYESLYLVGVPIFLYSFSLILLRNAYSKLSVGKYIFSTEQSAATIAAILKVILYLLAFPIIFLFPTPPLSNSLNSISNLIYAANIVVSLIFEFGFIKIGIEENSSGMKIAGILYIIGQVISGIIFFLGELIAFDRITLTHFPILYLNITGNALLSLGLLEIIVFSIRSKNEYENKKVGN